MSDQAVPRTAYAVVATGVLTPQGLPCFLSKDGNTTYPIPLFVHEDRSKAERRQKTLEARIRGIKFYDAAGMTPSKPFLGVVKVTLPPRGKGRKPTPEQVAKMQAGRKAADATLPKAAPVTAGKK